jgi:tRNA1(Val) A37 N6-methylase TrmN6
MHADLPVPADDESLDLLTGSWRIFQLKAGHRFSTDDLLTAWLARVLAPGAPRTLDLGAGIGSVGLLTLAGLGPDARLTAVEAQERSHQLCAKTVAWNGLGGRVTLRHGDLRDPAMLPAEERGTWPLVTGSPPYIPVGKGVISPHPQRAHCRIELRGDIFDYAATAAQALHPDGVFVFCHAAGDARPAPAVAAAGLRLWARVDVTFRAGRAPTIALFAAGHREAPALPPLPPVVIRDAAGDYTPAYLALRRVMGAPLERPRAGPSKLTLVP